MSPQQWTILGTVIAALIAALASWGTTRITHKHRPEHDLIDQLQEQVSATLTRLAKVEAKQDRSLRRERVRDDYISKLRRHIDEGLPPPPPAWPELLSRHMNYDEE